ncbi:hypothetical protein [uncultured Methanobrevibacter sp.]|uniref:hypothetical protein n=1 Tax=uncultured Methanobrevibacter sp. TaxID=253161 RepID=UPI0026005A07|nr:hypothetical protein [uncultured Methanobrevibacter sp.]
MSSNLKLPAKVKTTKKSIYDVFKGKSKSKWKIKKTTWNIEIYLLFVEYGDYYGIILMELTFQI